MVQASGLMKGKRGVIMGVANNRSIAWGIAKAIHAQGGEIAFTYQGEALKKRVEPLAASIGVDFVDECDVTSDAALDATFERVAERFGQLDFVVHCVAFARREELGGRFSDTSRDGFALALDVSCYSLIALVKRARPLMREGGSFLTMTYYGAEKVIPNYNVMGVAKAALEATVRYLAADLGADGIRVNAISAGPIKTLAAAGISGFRKSLHLVGSVAPLGNVSKEDVGETARFLLSDGARGITGEILYVDGGYHVMGAFVPEEA